MNNNILLLPIQKTKPAHCYFVDFTRIFELIKDTNNLDIKNINTARTLNKSDSQYVYLKSKCKHICWNSTPGSNFEIKNIVRYTGFIYIDIDDGISEENISEIKIKIANLDYVIATWKSFGGRGIGLLAFCPDLIKHHSATVFKECYLQIANEINNKLGLSLKVDGHCVNPNRLNTLSYDPDIIYKKTFSPFKLILKEERTTFDVQYKNIVYDTSLKCDIQLLEDYAFLNKYYYASFIIIDKKTRLPVYYTDEFKYNKDKHRLQTHFKPDVINLFENKNNSNTLAYSLTPFACIKLNIGENYYFPYKKRAKYLSAILLNYLFVNNVQNCKLEKNTVYNILIVLNSRCVKVLPPQGENPQFMPLELNEINLLATKLYERYINNEIIPSISTIKSIKTYNFYQVWKTNNPNYSGSTKHSAITLKEINKIKNDAKTNDWMKVIKNSIENYPGLKNSEYIEIISVENSITLSYSKELFYKYQKGIIVLNKDVSVLNNNHSSIHNHPNDTFNGMTMSEEIKMADKKAQYSDGQPIDAISKMEECISVLSHRSAKISQKAIVMYTGLSIVTVKRHYFKFKKMIKKNNNIIKNSSTDFCRELFLEFEFT